MLEFVIFSPGGRHGTYEFERLVLQYSVFFSERHGAPAMESARVQVRSCQPE